MKVVSAKIKDVTIVESDVDDAQLKADGHGKSTYGSYIKSFVKGI